MVEVEVGRRRRGRGGGFKGFCSLVCVSVSFFRVISFLSVIFSVFYGGNVAVIVVLLISFPRCAIFCPSLFSLSLCVPRTRRSAFLPSPPFLPSSIHLFIYTCSSRRACFLSLYLLSSLPLSPRTPPQIAHAFCLYSYPFTLRSPNTYIHMHTYLDRSYH